MQLFRVRPPGRGRVLRTFASGALVAMLGLATPIAVSSGAQAATAAAVACRSVSLPVTISGGSGPVAGTLCTPTGARVVQLLLHGFGWDQYYWDLPYQPDRYSFVQDANAAGFATLNISRLGVGESFHPLSTSVTFDSNASMVHQVVQALRAGALGAQFDKVVLVGHSIGTLVGWLEAGTFGDVDGIVGTAATHQPNLVNLAADTLTSYPATLDPKFADSGLDPGYVTGIPGARTAYYEAGNVDPAVIALDEELKQTGTLAERISFLPDFLFNASGNINVPVLVVVGALEPEFCNGLGAADCSSNETLAAGERPFYGPNATVDGLVVPNARHNVTLHLSAPQTNQSIQSWVTQRVGTS